jgi:hypothetical protein
VFITGAHPGDQAGASAGSAGDFNGDGHTDIVVGAPAEGGSGAVYVVTKLDAGDVDLSALGDGGFVIRPESGREIGFPVAGVGDVNGDGRTDIAIGSPHASYAGHEAAGRVYVVFGGTSPAGGELRLDDLGAHGFEAYSTQGSSLKAKRGGSQVGADVEAAGDVDGDGTADLVIGAPGDHDAGDHRGQAYVVFGKHNTHAVNLTVRSPASMHVYDSAATKGTTGATDALFGSTVTGVGDVSGDGLSDLLIGAPAAPIQSSSSLVRPTPELGLAVLTPSPRLLIMPGTRISRGRFQFRVRCLAPHIPCNGTFRVRSAGSLRCGSHYAGALITFAQGGFSIAPRAYRFLSLAINAEARALLRCYRVIRYRSVATFAGTPAMAASVRAVSGTAEAGGAVASLRRSQGD